MHVNTSPMPSGVVTEPTPWQGGRATRGTGPEASTAGAGAWRRERRRRVPGAGGQYPLEVSQPGYEQVPSCSQGGTLAQQPASPVSPVREEHRRAVAAGSCRRHTTSLPL